MILKKYKKKLKKLPVLFKFPVVLSLILFISSIVVLSNYGLRLDIDFTGGIFWELKNENEEEIKKEDLQNVLDEEGVQDYKVIESDSKDEITIEMPFVEEEVKTNLLEKFKEKIPNIKENSYRKVGSIVGDETQKKAIWAIIISLTGIVAYLAWSFRKVSKSETGFDSWHYGLAAILTLIHDIIIVLGVFALMQQALDFTAGLYFLIALLTILGYSVNDTIVVFNRLRENITLNKKKTIALGMKNSVKEAYKRSIYTSLTTLLAIGAMFYIGGEDNDTIKYMSLALFIGVLVGTYSSLFIAEPILYFLNSKKI